MSVAFTLPPSSIRHRKAFHLANKQSNETVHDWYSRLKDLAQPCNYGCYLEVLLLDKLIVGLDDTILERLCTEENDLSATDIIEISRNYDVDSEHIDIKPELVMIKQELTLSDVDDDDIQSNYDNCDTGDSHVDNSGLDVPLNETVISTQSDGERPKLFECYLCHKCWPTVGHLTYHFNRHHTMGTTSKCYLCFKWLKTPSRLVRHVNEHLTARPYHCDLCDFSFASSISLKRHMIRHSESKPNLFECSKCKKQFISQRHLRMHNKSHNKPSISLSEKLDEALKIRKSLKKAKGITTEMQFSCEICSKPFDNEKSYDDHMREHCENEWLCHLCGRKLKTKRNLINHYFVHTGEKPFNCDDCGKVFTCKDKLKLHLEIHKGIRPHVCLICHKAFIQKGHLASHSKSHVVKSFDFKCDQCPQQFTNKKRYEIHIRSHDGFEVCEVCGKSFKKKYHRTDHMRTHTGERPYSCNLCEKRFTQRSALSGHLKWHTKLKPPRRIKKKKSEDAIDSLPV